MRTKRIVWLTLCWLAGSACDSDFGTKMSGQACTRSSQCAAGLRCLEGLCSPTKKAKKDKAGAPAVVDAGEVDGDAAQPPGETEDDVQGT